jgi:ornithine carbamoyltransferase
MVPKHFLQLKDFSRDELDYLFARTRWIKDRFKRYEVYQPLRDRTLAMVFEKASTRTRVSFEAGMNQLGGIAINLNRGDTQLSRGEPIEDVARVSSRMVDVVMIRTFEQPIIERFAAHSRVPVINGLTNEYHPCQILADIYTFIEHRGSIQGKTVAWVGDSNNVCNTWLQAAAVFDFAIRVSTPPGYEVDPDGTDARGNRHYQSFSDPVEACVGAHLVTTDVWTSMGFEAENDQRRQDFARWQVDAAMMSRQPDALFMHCLARCTAAKVAADVLEGRKASFGTSGESAARAESAAGYLVCGRVDASDQS